MIFAGNHLQFAEVSAVLVRRDGTREDLGVLARHESLGHRVHRIWHAVRKAWPMLGVLLLIASRFVQGLSEHAIHIVPAATVIVNGGQAINSNLVSGLGGTAPKFIAWGTGAGTAGVTDTTLFTESTDETRTTGTASRVTTTVTNDTLQVTGTLTVVTANKTITNVGLFDAVTTGNLFLKADFTGQALLIGDSIIWTIKDKYA